MRRGHGWWLLAPALLLLLAVFILPVGMMVPTSFRPYVPLVGITAAAKNRGDLAMSLILNSALQVVLFLAPAIVLLSFFVAPAPLTLVLSPLLLGVLTVGVLLVVLIVTDGEGNAFEGAMLLGLYVIIAAATWWGPPIHL